MAIPVESVDNPVVARSLLEAIGGEVSNKPILVGEDNPYGGDPTFALYPSPAGSAGDRLCRKVLELTPSTYLREYDRANLCATKWSAPEAREVARSIMAQKNYVITLGAKVAKAFGLPTAPFAVHRVRLDLLDPLLLEETGGRLTFRPPGGPQVCVVAVLPHPSGRCRAWNEPKAFERARETLKKWSNDVIVSGAALLD